MNGASIGKLVLCISYSIADVISGSTRNAQTKEKSDDHMPHRHRSELQEVPGILILSPQDRPRRLHERRKVAHEKA